jgi:DNA-binding NtrC family response regulator
MAWHSNLPATCGPFETEISPACLPDLAAEIALDEVKPDTEAALETNGKAAEPVDYKASLASHDAILIRAALERHSGSILATARELGISKNTLKARMARYGLA